MGKNDLKTTRKEGRLLQRSNAQTASGCTERTEARSQLDNAWNELKEIWLKNIVHSVKICFMCEAKLKTS